MQVPEEVLTRAWQVIQLSAADQPLERTTVTHDCDVHCLEILRILAETDCSNGDVHGMLEFMFPYAG